MNRSFLDDPNFFFQALAIMICVPLAGALLSVCIQPSTPEERIQAHERTVNWIKDDLIVLVPRPGVECYVLRSHRSDVPNSLSCIGTVPTTLGN
jgi:hypothetical protein